MPVSLGPSLRRSRPWVLAALLILIASAGLMTAARASAIPPTCNPGDPGCDPGGGGGSKIITHKLTVTRPATGTVTSSPAGINCPAAGGGTCAVSDSQTVFCPDFDTCSAPNDSLWQVYTLTASGGPAGFAAAWSGSCSGGSCSVKLSADRSVAVAFNDVTDPSVGLSSPGAGKVGKTVTATATASDNAGVARVDFLVDSVAKASDTTAPYAAAVAMDGFAQGSSHVLTARAVDTSGRIADSSVTVTLDKTVNLTLGTVPAFTRAASVPLAIATDADASMSCRLNGGAPASCSSSFSPVGAATPDGAYTYTVTATDDVANTLSGTRSFVLDRTAPAIADFDGPVEGGQVTTDAVTITYRVVDANLDTVACTLDGAAVPCGATSAALAGLADGSHAFTVTALDKAGNTGAKTRAFSVKAAGTAPADPVPAAASGAGGGGGAVALPAPGKPAALAPNPATVRYGFTRHGAKTTFTRLLVANVAAGATVKASCRGAGCPKAAISVSKPSTVSLTGFLKRRLGAGAVLTIQVSKTGMSTKTVKLTVRAGKDPKLG